MINQHGLVVARYHYDPYGRMLGMTGPLAQQNRYRFSSKETQPFSELYYYGFRFYDPSLQRWINQDPIGEAGGINLYGFVNNDPVNQFDPLGLYGEIGYEFGVVVKVPTVGDLIDALKNSPSGSISEIVLSGHGGPDGMFFGPTSNDFLTAGSGVLVGAGEDIGDLLKDRLTAGAKIKLHGCYTAYGEDSLAKNLSEDLPGVTVVGLAGVSIGLSDGIWGYGAGFLGDLAKGNVIGVKIGFLNGKPLSGRPGSGRMIPKVNAPKRKQVPKPYQDVVGD